MDYFVFKILKKPLKKMRCFASRKWVFLWYKNGTIDFIPAPFFKNYGNGW